VREKTIRFPHLQNTKSIHFRKNFAFLAKNPFSPKTDCFWFWYALIKTKNKTIKQIKKQYFEKQIKNRIKNFLKTTCLTIVNYFE